MIGQPRFSPALRLTFKDRTRGRASIERLLDEPFDRIVPCHGDAIIPTDGNATLREAHAWLLN